MGHPGDCVEDDEDFVTSPLQTTAQKFMKLLEREMLNGRGDEWTRRWAVEDIGIPEELYLQMRANIKLSWKSAATTYDSFCDQRDLARARYLHVFMKSMDRGQFSTACRAIDSIVALDGLAAPGQLQLLLGDAAKSGITNTARDNVAILVEKMKNLAATRMASDDKIATVVKQIEDKTYAPGINGYPSHLERQDQLAQKKLSKIERMSLDQRLVNGTREIHGRDPNDDKDDE